VIQEVALKIDDAVRHLVNRLLPLLDRFNEPEGRTELVLDVCPRLVVVVGGGLVEQAPIDRADSHLRETVFVEDGHVLIFDLDDVDIRNDVLGLRRVVPAAGLGIEVPDDLDMLLQVVDGQSQFSRDFGHLMVL
jgi:hypothetical protein